MKKNTNIGIAILVAAVLVFDDSSAENEVLREISPQNVEVVAIQESLSSYSLKLDKNCQWGEISEDDRTFLTCIRKSNWAEIDQLLGTKTKLWEGDTEFTAITITLALSIFQTPDRGFPEIAKLSNIAALLRETESTSIDCESMIQTIEKFERFKLGGSEANQKRLGKALEKISEDFLKSDLDTINPFINKSFSLPFWAAYFEKEEMMSFYAPSMFEKDSSGLLNKFREEIFLATKFGCHLALKYMDFNYFLLQNSEASHEEKMAFLEKVSKFYSDYKNKLLREAVAANNADFLIKTINIINQFAEIDLHKVLDNLFGLINVMINKFSESAQKAVEAQDLCTKKLTQRKQHSLILGELVECHVEKAEKGPLIEKESKELKDAFVKENEKILSIEEEGAELIKNVAKMSKNTLILKGEGKKIFVCFDKLIELIKKEKDRITPLEMDIDDLCNILNAGRFFFGELNSIVANSSNLQANIVSNTRNEQIMEVVTPSLAVFSAITGGIPTEKIVSTETLLKAVKNVLENRHQLEAIFKSRDSLLEKITGLAKVLNGDFKNFGEFLSGTVKLCRGLMKSQFLTLNKRIRKNKTVSTLPETSDENFERMQ